MAGLGLAALVFAYVMGDEVAITDRVARRHPGRRGRRGDARRRADPRPAHAPSAPRSTSPATSPASPPRPSHWVDALEGTAARVLDTRKTLPGWRALQKYAVRCGGGVNHRFSLSDMAMVKDNHVIAAGGVVPALRGRPRGASRTCPSRSRSPTSTSCARCSRSAATGSCSTTWTPRRWPRRSGSPPAGPASRPPAGSPSTGPARSPRPASTSSRSAPSPTRWWSSTSAWTSRRDAEMTLLAADIGNSHTVLGLLRDGEVLAHWRVATDERRTADEWAVLVRGLLARRTRRRIVDGIAVCSTVPAVLHEWREMLATHFGAITGRGGRARHPHRGPGADGQPARGRLRPDRQRARRGHVVRRADDRRRLRHRHHLRRGEREGPVHRRRDRPRHRDLARGARQPRRPAAQGRAARGRGR